MKPSEAFASSGSFATSWPLTSTRPDVGFSSPAIILKGRIIATGTVAEIRAMGDRVDDHLTSVFLKLTGGSALQEIDEAV